MISGDVVMESPLFRGRRRLWALPHPSPPRDLSKPDASASHQERDRIFARISLGAQLRLHFKCKAREAFAHEVQRRPSGPAVMRLWRRCNLASAAGEA